MKRFFLKNGLQELVISNGVLRHFDLHRQLSVNANEVGGQLFARITKNKINLDKATGPSWFDVRSRFSFAPNKLFETVTIKRMFSMGFHYVGDWHTHPEPVPKPSNDDMRSIQSTYENSQHELAGFLMIIVGQNYGNDGVYIAIQDRMGLHQLHP